MHATLATATMTDGNTNIKRMDSKQGVNAKKKKRYRQYQKKQKGQFCLTKGGVGDVSYCETNGGKRVGRKPVEVEDIEEMKKRRNRAAYMRHYRKQQKEKEECLSENARKKCDGKKASFLYHETSDVVRNNLGKTHCWERTCVYNSFVLEGTCKLFAY